jgi:glycosyltransferase involved in cell wall biosynthesis/pyruvate-formate lyase-activating enzyme
MLPKWHYLVEITGVCNLACPSCPNGNSMGAQRAKGLMDFALFTKVIDKIKREPVEVDFVSLYNWGEPLLHPRVADMIRYVNAAGYRCTISTNLNNQTHLEEVIRANPYQLRVSLSGFSQEFYSRTHTNGSIEKVKTGLVELRRLLDLYRSKMHVEVCYHKYKDNTTGELAEMRALSERLGFAFAPTWAFFGPVEKVLRLCDSDEAAEGYPTGESFAITGEDQKLLNLLAISPQELIDICKPINDQPCILRDTQTAVNFDGSVTLCCGVWDDRYRIAEDFCAISHEELQRRKHAAPLCRICRKNALHMVGVYSMAEKIDEVANVNIARFEALKNFSKEKTPAISVVITAYNYGRFIGKAVASVLSQDFTDIELLVLNNASTDNTDEVVKRFTGDPRLVYIVNETNIGARANGHKGLALARADYSLFLSADDFLQPGALAALHDAVSSNPDADFAYGKYVFVDQNDKVTQEVKHPGWLPFSHKGRLNELADLLQFDCYISTPTVLFKKEVLRRFPEWTDKVRVGDYEFFLRLALNGCVSLFVNKILASFRLHGAQMSVGGDIVASGSHAKDQITLLEMYVTPENAPKLVGYEIGMLQLLTNKIEAYFRSADRDMNAAHDIQRRAQTAVANVSMLQKMQPEGFPMVSVIVPTRDRPDMLKCALASILAQTYPNFEIIVINDGGADIDPIIAPLNIRNNIRQIRHEMPKERSAARNAGLRAARGKYIAYLDDDDRYYPDHLRILINFLEINKVKVAYTDACRAVEELENGAYIVKQRQLQFSNPFDPDRLLVENLFPNLCVVHARSSIDEAGLFDETLDTHEDWDFWIRLSRRFSFHHIPVITAEYSYRNDKSNTTTARRGEFNHTRETIYKKYRTFAELNPGVIDAQKKALAAHTLAFQQMQQNENVVDLEAQNRKLVEEFKQFLAAISAFIEKGRLGEAIDFYDTNRKKFPPTIPEMEQIDRLMEKVRRMRAGVASGAK